MKKLLLALAFFLALRSSAAAQGCGNSNPNCIVPDVTPATTSNAQAANTKFVQQALAAWALQCSQLPSFTGDISNTACAVTVTGLQGRPVANTAPSPTFVLAWTGSAWAPSAAGGIEQINPGGRLTVSSGVCTPVSDTVGATTIFYAPCLNEWVPIYDGTIMTLHQFTSSPTDTVGLSLALGSNWAALTLYDVFVGLNSGTVTLCTGPAWTNSGVGTSTRGTGAGTSELALFKGMMTNKNSMTCRFNNTTTFTCAVNQCTYLGTVRTNSNTGQIDFKFGGGAAGGGFSCFCIWNMYNQVLSTAKVWDTNGNFTYSSTAWTPFSGNDALIWVAGQQINSIDVTVGNLLVMSNLGVTQVAKAGCSLNTSAPANADFQYYAQNGNPSNGWNIGFQVNCKYKPQLGLNGVWSVVRGDGTNTVTWILNDQTVQYIMGNFLW